MIHWNASPEIIHLGFLSIRWYGLLFAIAFWFGHYFTRKFFTFEKIPVEYVDPLLIYMVVGTIVGARLGHCLFYEPEIYLADPIRILKVWEGGLASHGAFVGIITGIFLFVRKYKVLSFLGVLDRIITPISLGCGLIRIGNLFNSEIIGRPATVPWAFVFERVDQVPRHPTQLYEAIGYLSLFALLYFMYWKPQIRNRTGLLLGIFLVLSCSWRAFVEIFKENQVAFENHLALNMGQLLSLPIIAIGAFLIVRAYRNPMVNESPAARSNSNSKSKK